MALVVRVGRGGGARTLSLVATHFDGEGPRALRLQQLARVVAVAEAERAGPPERDVVVLGDLNLAPEESAPALEGAGFARAAVDGIDQIWIGARLRLVEAAAIPTRGASDHASLVRATIR